MRTHEVQSSEHDRALPGHPARTLRHSRAAGLGRPPAGARVPGVLPQPAAAPLREAQARRRHGALPLRPVHGEPGPAAGQHRLLHAARPHRLPPAVGAAPASRHGGAATCSPRSRRAFRTSSASCPRSASRSCSAATCTRCASTPAGCARAASGTPSGCCATASSRTTASRRRH